MWLYKGKEINEITDLPKNTFGFVYQTTHTSEYKYIGKKSLIYNRKKKLGKKELITLRLEGKLGRLPKHKIVQVESDWKTYYGSHNFIKEALSKKRHYEFKRKILEVAFNKKELTYLECKWQFNLNVLEDKSYLNDNILGKFFDKDFK